MKAVLIFIGAAALVIATSAAFASSSYEVDEDHDGRVDRTLMLEQSDALA